MQNEQIMNTYMVVMICPSQSKNEEEELVGRVESKKQGCEWRRREERGTVSVI